MADVEIGYTLSCEEHGPRELVAYARRAEQAGFSFATISDHFHPWISRQGNSPFVWAVIGGIAASTERLRLATAVTCPTVRLHPAIVAQAAATAAAMMPGRFMLGVGTGEHLNEHVLGDRWPPAGVRREMLREAVSVMRELWEGGEVEHDGAHYTVENARLYTLPEEPPPILAAASGREAAELAGEIGDGFVGTAPNGELIEQFERAGGEGKPRYGQVTLCVADTEAEGRRIAREWWPNVALRGELGQVLPLPAHFEQATENVSEQEVGEAISCGQDPERHLESLKSYAEAGYSHLFLHQVGPDQERFFRFYEQELAPRIAAL